MATKSRTQWLAHGLYEQGTVLLLSAQKGEALAGVDGIAVDDASISVYFTLIS